MTNRQEYLNQIHRCLAILQSSVTLANSLNLQDINIRAENFYRDLFNLLGYTFNNTNFDLQNAAYVDLLDTVNKRAVQVTSQNDNEKIFSTIEGFYDDEIYKDYKLEVLLISKDAKDYRTDFTAKGKYNFDHVNDVIDVKRLFKIIDNREIDEIENVARFLTKQVIPARTVTECNEVETIMSLISFLSSDSNRTHIQRDSIVDPARKFNRFAEHVDYLTSRYGRMCAAYAGPLAEARRNMDSMKSLIISGYLRDESDEMLSKHRNDPKEALKALVDYFNSKLSYNGIGFDKQAIQFYLLDEMIQCNVFPLD